VDLEVELQQYLNERVKKKIDRDLSYAFYDMINNFYKIDFHDGENDLRKKGVSKEHRTDTIVMIGLFMDANGIPVIMSIFPGNTNDSLTIKPTMKDVKKSYGLGRIIMGTDKGLNSAKNIDVIVNNGDGFIFSQILKEKKGQHYNEKLFTLIFV
jgi:transposase